jgi:hypothetical protein
LEGRPIYDDMELVEILIPGDRLSRPVLVASEESSNGGPTWAQLYPREYEAFKRGQIQATSGTPLEHWPTSLLTAARVAELKALNIFSVEDLAAVADGYLGRMGMGARELREQARAYIARGKEDATSNAMAARIADLEAKLAAVLEMRTAVPAQPAEPVERDLADLSNDELKAYIKQQTGEPVRGNPSRETLIERASALAMEPAE